MKLSIIVVNQNQCRALRQALSSVNEAARHFDYEMIVVDNASIDRSVQVVQTEFPHVKLLGNEKELSYTKAANQGIEAATGEYILLVDPCTITGEDTLDKALSFMESHPHAGALTVRALDAEGNFIPASKNCIPSAWIQFFKFSGLSRLFPKSRLFSRRFKPGWDEEFETTETDIICNSFMLMHKSVLDKTGFFDERFQMYGMDIDLSYRIRLAGFMNYYFAKTFVIHQQSKKADKYSWQYIKNFYGAMLTFAGKYLVRMPELRIKGPSGWTAPSYEFER
ncbi:glycosyltransferase family 2 protein [Mucilaginibacter sp. Bleaf8]|uniref:glycosyltransferase family 2 protein n=1 Tax=Mucilaginibacter sp. Bleaf8 TaxID=2834430 RepID=UPI001BCAB2B1|nr:glycosyltransferase family 2 protein [Mucilaginibacter sp. Bleaf8]MBS7562873.1 glycosyltransferase family 2 protein [Mucilaginibacter sp. Bleaf8]